MLNGLQFLSIIATFLTLTNQMTDSKIPQTADGQIIYPGMSVFICQPYSEEKFRIATVITEYITRLSVTDLSELEDFLVNNFGDN